MKRFLMLVGVAVVAAAMYVAASPASPQASGPTAKQFNALKKQVATLSKNLKALKKDETQVKGAAAAAVGYIGLCFLTNTTSSATIAALPVSQFGSTTGAGYAFGTAGAPTSVRTALDVAPLGAPQYYLQEVNASCMSGTSALRHGAAQMGGNRLRLWVERSR